jgi:protein involved in polysaccharide export with SLBB domain
MIGKIRSALVFGALTMLLAGCDASPWNDFLNPGEPKILDPDQKPLIVPILDTLASGIEEPDTAFADATDIEPGDLIPDVSDYKIGPNDLVSVSIFDLLGEGTGEQVKVIRVTETGSISLPFISPVKAQGLTERELEQAVAKAYEDARLIRGARVSVSVQEARARTFSVQGNVGSPGEYQITRPDFRMLDALVTSRGPAAVIGVPYAYVIRKTTQPGETGPNSSVEPGAPTNSNSPLPSVPSPTSPIPTPGPASQPGDLLSPPPTTPAGPQGRGNSPASGVRATAMDDRSSAGSSHIFKFDDVENPTDVRVIRVPIDQLRQYGELKYNIVIRPSDMIIVPDPTNGVYYFGGHVLRAGVFSLTGTDVTLKQAWIAAGGADDFAFPNRTEVIRRIGSNREVCVRVDLSKILALSEPDIYLKPNDVIFVGTHFIAPFLAAVRNSFRLTYGFGFLYDRNYYNGPNGF